ncbi:hypothetical protein [Wigglesworthia glossinidia]|uniref:hypothetical protein n=1 Tax=Wigglesworthia glossinidia TaxID=51229 RepID=UPI0003162991|nr:hypothetical protein [Wigglesworthia glossinidia]
MVNKDYIYCQKFIKKRQKKRKHTNLTFFQSPLIVTILAFFISFFVIICFTLSNMHHNNEKNKEISFIKNNVKKLPPKPKIRWYYIKELENLHLLIFFKTKT